MKIYNMTEIKSLQKQRFGARQLIAVCLVLVMFFGTAFDYAIAFSERQNLDFALESDRYDLLVDHDELFDLSHWQLEDNELTELPPEILEALLREQEEYFALSSRVREKAIFLELLNEGLRFSDLTEANRFFIFRQLDIACAAHETVKQLFEQMESDGFSLAESIELVRIISSGIFDYEEAQILFNTIPSTLERLIEVVYFEQFVQIFDVADKINARRLINMPFYSTNEFMGLYILIEEIREEEKDLEEEIKEEETQEETVEPPPAEETTDPPSINGDSTEPKETDPPIIDENIPANGGYQSNDDEEHPMLDESGSVAHEQELMAGKRVILFEGHSSYLEEHISYSDEYFVDVNDDQIYREEDELILEDDEDYPAENYEREQLEETPERDEEDVERDKYVYLSLVMLADSDAFELARQMFLTNSLMIEIEATFIYGEALREASQANLQQQDASRTEQQRRFANYSSEEALANILFADVFFTSEDPYLRYLGELMFPYFEARLMNASTYTRVDEYGNVIDFEFDALDYNMYQAITPMSTIDHGDIVSSPFALRFNANESVSLNTGASMYRVNVLSLPGRNGFNLNLDMVYSSTRAYSNGHGAISVLRNLHGLGEGWIFDLPYIWDNVLYVPGRGSFALSGNTILEYTLHDMRLFHDTTFLSGTIRSDRRLTFHNGTSYFFNGAHVIGMVDRFGNTIRFEYANVSGFNNLRLLSRIVDTNGRVVTFTYNALSESRTVTVTSPDNSTFAINMTRNAQLPANAFLVSSIQNQVGAVTGFTYRGENVNLHFTNKNPSAAGLRTDIVWLLSRVNYPSGAQLRFEYGRHDINLGRDGSRHLWRVSSRALYYNRREYQRTTFGYEGDHTAFPQHVTSPPANHTYRTTVTKNTGLRVVHTFNNRHLNIYQRTYNANNALRFTQVITYNNDRLPISIETTEHSGTRSRTTTQQFTYNRYGQATQMVSPLAQGSSHERYRIDNTFDARFGLPLTRTSRPNATTIIVERNTLSTDGKRVLREYVYENNVRKSRTDFFHDAFGNVTEIREFYGIGSANFIQTQITYNSGTMPSLIRRTGVRDANGILVGNIDRRFTYDTMWRTLSETDPLGAVTRWQYDRIGRITRIDFPSGGFTTYTYDDRRNTLTHRTVLGAVYTYQYSGLGKLVSVTVGGVEILRNIYNTRMQVSETRNAQGINSSQRTVFTYDVFHRVTLRRGLSPTGEEIYRKSTAFFDIVDTEGNRRVTTTVTGTGANAGNAPNIQTFVQYDRFGRRTQEGTIGGRIVTYTHDLAGRVITEQSLGVHNTFTYNVHGVTSVRNILGHTAQNTYDMLGRLVSSTDFMGNTQRFTYDALGRLISHRIPFERIGTTVHYSEVRYFYDRNSNITRQSTLVNAPGQAQVWATTENTFRHNRLISSTTGGANGIRTEYTYDLAGNVLTKTVGGATTTFEYNNRGRLISTTDALGQTETFTHDANGHVITHVDRNGTIFQMTYNNLGRMTRKEARQNGELVGFRSYAFHPTGALRQVDNGSHVITYYYDAQGRVRRQTETGGIVKTFAYNTANNLTQSRVYVDNVLQSNMTYTFDAAQRVETVAANGEILSTYTYNANNRRTSTVIYTGLRTTYTYNLAGLVTNVTNRRSNNLIISDFNYLYYLDGNTRQVTERLSGVTRTTTYTYDLARRLTRESATGFEDRTESFTFDNRGNRVSRVVTGTENYTVTYTYDLNNRLLTSTRTPVGGNAEITTFTYDNNGNQLTKITGDRIEEKTYNAFNQLVSVFIPGDSINTWARLQTAIQEAPANTPYTIYISDSFDMTGGAIIIPQDRNIILVSSETGNANVRTLTQRGYERHFIVEGGQLTLGQNITLCGDAPPLAAELLTEMIESYTHELSNFNEELEENRLTAGFVETDGAFTELEDILRVEAMEAAIARFEETLWNTTIIQFEEKLQEILASSDSVNGGGVLVSHGGTFTMRDGSTIENIISPPSHSGTGVAVTNGAFNMQGGIISNNISSSMGVVHIHGNNSHMTMTGGAISNNRSLDSNGGGISMLFGTVTMTGGTISNNTAPSGGGVFVGQTATFTMSGTARIVGNEATRGVGGGGVTVNGRNARFTMNGGTIGGSAATEANIGSAVGGVRISDGTMVMNGGTIDGNVGGGVRVHQSGDFVGTMTMNGGTISNNTAVSGAGLLIAGGSTVTMTDGTISNNEATSRGGGVHVEAGTFSMRNAVARIENNTAGSQGGGIHLSTGTVNLTAGTIANNVAGSQGGGIFSGASASLSVGPDVVISGNSPEDVFPSINALASMYCMASYTEEFYATAGDEIDMTKTENIYAIIDNTNNAFNQLTSVSTPDIIVTYAYRADGLRHSKTVDGVTTTHVWLMGNIILERNAQGAITNRFDRSLSGRLIRSPQHGYYLFNARGDVVQRANAQTAVLRSYRYTAFGVELNPNENNRNPFRFAGEYWDAETGTYYLRARIFNPRTGRFTQPDPHWNIHNMVFGDSPMARHGRMIPSSHAIMQAGNLFVFTMNNPVRWTDPSGRVAVPAGVNNRLQNTAVIVPGAFAPGSPAASAVTGSGGGGGSTSGGGFMVGGGDLIASATIAGVPRNSSVQNIRFDWWSTTAQRVAFDRAINYLREGSAYARKLIDIIENGDIRFTLHFTSGNMARFCAETRIIRWNPLIGTDWSDGSVGSAAMLLAHELGHVAQYLQDYKNAWLAMECGPARDEVYWALERLNIRTWEIPIATDLGEPIRCNEIVPIGFTMTINPTYHRTRNRQN